MALVYLLAALGALVAAALIGLFVLSVVAAWGQSRPTTPRQTTDEVTRIDGWKGRRARQ